MVKALTEGTNFFKKVFAQVIIHFILTGFSLGTIYNQFNMNIPFLLSFVGNLCKKLHENVQKIILNKTGFSQPLVTHKHRDVYVQVVWQELSVCYVDENGYWLLIPHYFPWLHLY